jgi:hypothetical protein
LTRFVNFGFQDAKFHLNLDAKSAQQLVKRSRAGAEFLVYSGTTFIFAPSSSVAAFYSQFVPAASATGSIPCNAQVPPFAIAIGGQAFNINPSDLLYRNGADCIVGVQPTPPGGTNVLGDVFPTNVLADFDWGNETIR